MAGTFIWTAIGLIALGTADLFGRPFTITDLFFVKQDAPLLLATAVALVAIGRVSFAGPLINAFDARSYGKIVGAMALAAAGAAWIGVFLVYRNYPLSMDEFMADFDAAIFRRGRLFGVIPPEWSAYKHALQPIFLMDVPSPVHWSSSYLPVNAMFRAVGDIVGLKSLVNPLWTGVAVISTWAVGRRLWPQSPQIAFAAALLLATSSQVIVTGMTAYAMPAHLALNMVWLWCFLRGGRAGHAAALIVGFAATGLHQLVFHPLFVAPFVLQLWLDRRWALATLYTLAYAAIGLF